MRSVLPIAILFILTGVVAALEFPVSTTPIKLSLWSPSTPTFGKRDIAENAGIFYTAPDSQRQSYYTLIQVGAVYFRVALDTGSSDLWLMSSDCKSSVCDPAPKFPLAYQSDTFITVNNNETAFRAGYTDGTVVSGIVAKETVRLGNITVAGQALGLISEANVTFHDQISGIFGLGFPRLSSIAASTEDGIPFFAHLASGGHIDYPLFGISLTGSDTGTLSLGAIDASVVANVSQISWHEIVEFSPFTTEANSSSYLQWVTPLSGFSVNGTSVRLTPTYPEITANRTLALFDVGTNGLYGPYADVNAIYSEIEGSRLVDEAGQWVVPCDTTKNMSLRFGSREFALRPTDYIIGRASGNPNLCLSWPRALPPSSDGVDWQIGTTFLRTVYTVFSYGINGKEAPLIGLYPLFNTSVPQTPEMIDAYLSVMSATVATTLPNVLIPTPSLATPSYAFNTSVPAPTGGLVSSGLGTSSYDPILASTARNLSAIPMMTMFQPQTTVMVTDHNGAVVTSISFVSQPAMTLGVPPGWNGGENLSVKFSLTVYGLFVSVLWTLRSSF